MRSVGSLGSRGVFAMFLALSLGSCATTINDSAPTTSLAGGESSTSGRDRQTSLDESLSDRDLLAIMLGHIEELSAAMQKSDRTSGAK
ncbi:MAG: hypothetical protein ACKOFM_02570, partial [Actinomycetota bacterium]